MRRRHQAGFLVAAALATMSAACGGNGATAGDGTTPQQTPSIASAPAPDASAPSAPSTPATPAGEADFVLVDVRGKGAWEQGHIAGAVHIPHRELGSGVLDEYPDETVFVVYCAGPHCNGADRAALRLAQAGRPVKKMIGGATGWLDEGFELVRG